MMETKDARLHTGRNDCNGRPRGSRRRTKVRAPSAAEAEDLGIEADREASYSTCVRNATTEAGDEGLDGLHSR